MVVIIFLQGPKMQSKHYQMSSSHRAATLPTLSSRSEISAFSQGGKVMCDVLKQVF